MTTIYFVRHAEPDYTNHDDMSRGLTEKGIADSKLITEFLADKNADIVFSSPYKRAVDTIRDFAETSGLKIHLEYDFRERKVDSGWIEDFASFCKAQWTDFDYKRSDGESLREVQGRNISALNRVLTEHRNQTIVIGTHGTALSTIINFYDEKFDYAQFEKIKGLMPWVVKFTFQDTVCTDIQQYNLFELR
ncbi:MAG: histidine phosphatase family protein [Eubacterium sp.]|nr:histidine phosphatase family protein [Eubacterium sp.]